MKRGKTVSCTSDTCTSFRYRRTYRYTLWKVFGLTDSVCVCVGGWVGVYKKIIVAASELKVCLHSYLAFEGTI